MVFGTIGIIMMLGPVIKESIECSKIEATVITNNATLIVNQTTQIPPTVSRDATHEKKLYDICLTPGEVGLSILFLFLAPVLWGLVTGN